MNEQIITDMEGWFKKVPKPKDRLYLEMWNEVEKQTIARLRKNTVEQVCEWLKSNMNNDPRNGPVWLNNVSVQTYTKLWKYREVNDKNKR